MDKYASAASQRLLRRRQRGPERLRLGGFALELIEEWAIVGVQLHQSPHQCQADAHALR